VDIASILKASNIPAWGKPKGPNLFDRLNDAVQYFLDQHKQQMWLYNRRILTGPSTEVLAMDDNSNIIYGVNFASADYLGLAKNEFAKDAAIEAVTNFGVNSAGSPLAFGATK
jgi:glycine C-acetyltransferase